MSRWIISIIMRLEEKKIQPIPTNRNEMYSPKLMFYI